MKNFKGTKAFGAHFKIPRKLVNRETYILSKCAGKRVLHVGCVDFDSRANWEPVIQSSRWLHAQIERVAKKVIGIDNADEAVKLLRDRYNIKNVYMADAQHLETLEMGTFDVIVAGEILEHLPCPGSFLVSAHGVLEEEGQLIVTTTNAYCMRRFIRIAFGKESVHVDHVAYYSHSTLNRLAEMYDYTVVEQCSYRIPNIKPLMPYMVERIASWISPNLCEGIICLLKVANLQTQA
jgi:2-polyprenyl-3-methyl-5-hydroxy-6-metoxy-1,4-benzoquinol methylase